MFIRAVSVSRAFGPNQVLRSINLHVDRGDSIGLVGRNGVGKTTLLKVLMGQIQPDTGELEIKTENIGYLSQFPEIDLKMTVAGAVGTPYGRIANIARRIAEIEEKMADPVAYENLDWNAISSEYSRLQEEFVQKGGHHVDDRVISSLETVGLSADLAERKMGELSGGETTKVMLARVLVQGQDADVLFLDEPTSHLDMETTEWLEDYLLTFKGGVIVVSHDRYFLDKVVTRVAELDDGELHEYTGNYSTFLSKRTLDLDRKQKQFRKEQAERNRLTEIAQEQFRRNPYLTTHKTRMKMLERREDVEGVKGKKDVAVRIEAASKSGKDVLIIKNLSVKRGKETVVEGIDLHLEIGDKLGIFGPNGAGKTTLLKAILEEIPCVGDLWVAPGAKIGYFAQGHEILDMNLTPEEQLLMVMGKDEKLRVRGLLARLLLHGEEVERPISTLSGGERARVALAVLLAGKRNLLILDEPTNYLDIPARTAVESALMEYPGSLMVVTHDRYFLDSVCNKVAEVKDGGFRVFAGNYSRMKGFVMKNEVVENAHVYRVITGFKDWVDMRKLKAGERITIADSEMERYRWALDTGKLKRVPGKKERKKVRKMEE